MVEWGHHGRPVRHYSRYLYGHGHGRKWLHQYSQFHGYQQHADTQFNRYPDCLTWPEQRRR
ncbi:MAG: hypothetical protein IPJ40_16525 [Saprospirales bacterium]|nr:hypothetical protein [Saprospirales bacterium]